SAVVATCCSTKAQTPTSIRFANAPALPAGSATQSLGKSSQQTAMPLGEMPAPPNGGHDSDPQFAGGELTLPQLIEEVQDRNPSLAAMAAAWQAAAQRY